MFELEISINCRHLWGVILLVRVTYFLFFIFTKFISRLFRLHIRNNHLTYPLICDRGTYSNEEFPLLHIETIYKR